MSRLEAAADRLELRELVERYGIGADSRDRELFGSVFTDDGVLVTSRTSFDGREAIVSTIDYLESHYSQTMHFVGNHDVTLDGDAARGLTYCLAHHVYARDGVQRDTLMVVRYRDEYRRTGAAWLIASRTLSIDWTEDRPLNI